MSLVVKLHDLHGVLGSWPLVEKAVGIDRKTRRHYTNVAGGALRAGPESTKRINRAHELRRPFPLSDHLRVARAELTRLKAFPGSDELEGFLRVLEGFLEEHQPENPAKLVEYSYMRMLVSMSKALHSGGRSDWFEGRFGESLRIAQKHAEFGKEVADRLLNIEPGNEQMSSLQAFLFINWIQIIQEQTKRGYENLSGKKMTFAEKEKLFRDHNALSTLQGLMGQFPYLWQAAYNGLEQASSLKDDVFAIWFYNELKRLDPGFQDFDYTPGEAVAISREPEMVYFHDKYRSELHIANPGKG